MKNETTASLLESGELMRTEDVAYMIDLVLTLMEKATESEFFFDIAIGTLTVWREAMEQGEDTAMADAVVVNIMGGKL